MHTTAQVQQKLAITFAGTNDGLQKVEDAYGNPPKTKQYQRFQTVSGFSFLERARS